MRTVMLRNPLGPLALLLTSAVLVGCQPAGVGTVGPEMDGPEAANATGGRMSDASSAAGPGAASSEATSAAEER